MAYPYRQAPPPRGAPPPGPIPGRPPPQRDNRYLDTRPAGSYDQGYADYGNDGYDNYQQDPRSGYANPQRGGPPNGGYNGPPPRAPQNGYDQYGQQQGGYDYQVPRPAPLRQASGRPGQWPLNSPPGIANQDSAFPSFPGSKRRNSVEHEVNRAMGSLDLGPPGPARAPPPTMRPHTSNSNRPIQPRNQTAPQPSFGTFGRPPPIPEAGRRTADPYRTQPPPQFPEQNYPQMQPPKRSATMPVPQESAPPPSPHAANQQVPLNPSWNEPRAPPPIPAPLKQQSQAPKAAPAVDDAAADFLNDYFDAGDAGDAPEPDMPNFDAMPSSSVKAEELIPGEPIKKSPPSANAEPKGAYAAYRPPGGIPERQNSAEYQYDPPLRSPTYGPPPTDYNDYPPHENYSRPPVGRGMPPPAQREGYEGRGGYPPGPPPNQYGGGPMNGGQQPYPGPQQGYGNPRDMYGTGTPGSNPDALPQHPAPYRPGLAQAASKPPPIRQYDNPPPPPQQGPPPSQGQDRRASAIVTYDELRQLQQAAAERPSDYPLQLTLVKKLVEASVHLIDDNGRADQRTRNKNRERYVMDAYKNLKKLAGAGYPDAMFYLADCYGQGRLGLQEDPKEAFALYQSAAKLGHPESAYRLAVCCEMGQEGGGGTRRDPIKAVQWYRRAAALGDTPAMYKMGMILLKGLLGQQRNPREALSWLKRAAERADEDNPHALHELALLYENPQGNDAVIRDENYALELLIQAGELGYKFSQFRLGAAYEYGLLGCPVDARQSIFWYTRAAAQGEHQSELALSGWYLTGAEGILQQSDTEAYLWARKAAISGLAKAEYAMGYFSEVGIGVPANLDDAKRWYWKASSQNFLKARERLEDLRRGGAKMQKTRVSRSAVNRQNEGDCVVM